MQSANYTQSATSTVSTTCGVIDPVAAQTALNGSQRHVYNDAMGNLCFETVVTSGQPVLIGCGMVSFNKGQLKSTGIAFNDGKCQWTSSTTIDITVTAKNTIKIDKDVYKRQGEHRQRTCNMDSLVRRSCPAIRPSDHATNCESARISGYAPHW